MEARQEILKNPVKKRFGKTINGVLVLLIVYIIFVELMTGGNFITLNNLLKIARQVSIMGIMACAVTTVMITGNVDLSIGSMASFLACVSCVMVEKGTLTALAVPAAVGAVCGLLNGLLVGGLKLNPFIATIGMSSVFQAAATIYSNSQYLVPAENASYKFLGQGSFLSVPVLLWLFAAVAAIFAVILNKTVLGTQFYTTGANRLASRFSGISISRVIISAYVMVGITVGFAAALLCSRVMSAQPEVGSGYEFDVVMAVVLGGVSIKGGKGSIPGTILGVAFIGILSNSFVLLGLDTTIQYMFKGLILIGALWLDNVKGRWQKA